MGQSHAAPLRPREGVWPALERSAREVVDRFGAAPCAVVACSRRVAGSGGAPGRGPVGSAGGWERGFGVAGRLGWDTSEPLAHVGTVFDLASVTKPFTALTAARLHARGALDLDAPLEAIDARFRDTPAGSRSLAHLLRHRAGLDAHLRLFAPLEQGRPFDAEAALAVAAGAMREGCSGPPPPEGFPAVYSDLGYLLAGAAMASLRGVDLDALLDAEVSAPVGSGATSARRRRAREAAFPREVAPTEVVAYRGGTVRGLVHDDNAFAFAGDAACGHAGFFGTAGDVVALGEALLDALEGHRDDWISKDLLASLLAPWPGGSHVFGFDTKSGSTPSSGHGFGPRTFGHLGFTGTSLWIDPDRQLVGVLLTNRVHPSREHVAIRAARPVVYDAIADAASTNEPLPPSPGP